MIKAAPDMKVRLSADLREKIEASARRNNRTMNAEIVARLERSFYAEEQVLSSLPSHDLEDRLAKLEQAVIRIIFDERWDKMESKFNLLEELLKQ